MQAPGRSAPSLVPRNKRRLQNGDSSCRSIEVQLPLQVASCYPKEVQGFAAEVSGLLEEQAAALDTATRLALVGAHRRWLLPGPAPAQGLQSAQPPPFQTWHVT